MTCHFCGGDTPCDCTADCRHCRHIGHEHYADGRCRGTVYFDGPMRVEDCEPHTFEPFRRGPLVHGAVWLGR